MKHPFPLQDARLARLISSLEQDDFVLLETTRITGENHRTLLFSKPVTHLALTGRRGARDFLREVQSWLDQGYFLAGWLAYEFGYLLEPVLMDKLPLQDEPLADLGVFHAPLVVEHLDLAAGADASGPLNLPAGPASEERDASHAITNLRLSIGENEYQQAIDSIKSYIAAGDTYQVNYTLKLLFDFKGSPLALYRALRKNQSVAYGAYIQNGPRRILSFSPELFFRKTGTTCTVRPMKGTMPRGRTTGEDEQNRQFLQNDSKNRSENVMIVDLLRNDLGRLAKPGTVRTTSLFEVETFETLHQMTSTISAELPAGLPLMDLFKALFPCGSVTGAPKIRTMEIIRELEHEPRGVYTGAIGYLAPDGDAMFNVPIRTVVLDHDKGEMGIGSGIVHDSQWENEWRECRLKAHFLTRPKQDFQLIETILWQARTGYFLLAEHLKRLADSAAYFQFLFDEKIIREKLSTLERSWPGNGQSQRVRLLLAENGAVTLNVSPCAAPCPPASGHPGPLPRVTFSAARTDSSNVFLFHKTTRRELYERERQKAVDAGFYEVLFQNERGEVTEGAITTVFIKKEETFYTPPLACGLLPGVFRAHFMACAERVVREKILFPADLDAADAIYLANSVRGMIQVSR
ncbi:MAG: aminodeoxychorismate synthase component I [Deltaproteobacteria bacterium]|nr:aminodeoxychorismate synthase component I [Deltaproteobacteria bacterium]